MSVCVQMWPAFRQCYLMDVLRRHYRMRIITPPQPFMDTSKHHLAVQFPHAVFPMSCFLNPALVGAPGTGAPTGHAPSLRDHFLFTPC